MKLNGRKVTPNELAKYLVWTYGKSATNKVDWRSDKLYINGCDPDDGTLKLTGSDKEFDEMDERILKHSNRVYEYFGIEKLKNR